MTSLRNTANSENYLQTKLGSGTSSRLHIDDLLNSSISNNIDDGSEVIRGLTQPNKSLPARYFYDDHGSGLFEKICELPEYYPTRTEASILQNYGIEIAKLTGVCEIVELGSGSSTKTRLLLDAYQALGYPLRYVPIDVSAKILEDSAKQLLIDYPSLQIHGLVSRYELALQQLMPSPLFNRMICFLGSTLGNFNQQECDMFFIEITSALEAGDYFLLGVDLQKPVEVLEAAYNDSQKVTAEFNLNMLSHLNKRFNGNFDLSLFEHRALYNQAQEQIEMHLICKRSHRVHLEALDLTVIFREGETVLTEISRKFNLKKMQNYLQERGLKPIQCWTDDQQWFGLILCQF